MLSDKIKNIIFEYLLDEIYKVEIIYYRDSIWFIDRENRYWYFEYHKVDKHLWWRWSHFTTALTMFSMEAEKEQYLLGELVNMILTKKQKLEEKYPNKIFKTVGSVMNFEDKVDKVLNSEIDTTRSMEYQNINRMDEALNCEVETTKRAVMDYIDEVDEVLNFEVETTGVRFFNGEWRVEEALNCEVKTAYGTNLNENVQMKEALNCEVETTFMLPLDLVNEVEEILNNEVETTPGSRYHCWQHLVDAVLNNEVETTQSAFFGDTNDVIDSVLNFEVEKTGGVFYNDEIITQEVLDSDVNISSGEMIDENEMMNKVLSVDIETIGYSKTHRLRPVTGALDYNPETMDSVIGGLKNEVKKVLDNPVEIKSIEKLKGENPFQDIIVSHILDESDKVTDKLKMKEDDYVKTYSHDVYMCDHLVQNVLDIGVNSIHYDTHNHQPIVDGILKKA